MNSHPPSNLLQPSRPTTATQSSDTTSFGSQGLLAPSSSSTPHPPSSSSPTLPSTPPFEIHSTFSKYALIRGTVRIRVEQATFYCHREVLALASPFFSGVLAGGWSETEPVPRPVKEEKRNSFTSNDYDQEEPTFGLPDDPLYPSSSSSDTASLVDAVPPSMTASYASSSVIADSDEDENEYDSFVECRLRIQEEKASSSSSSLLHLPPSRLLTCSVILTRSSLRLPGPPLPRLPTAGLPHLVV